MGNNYSIWITWARPRRTIELADALGCKLYVLLESSSDIPYRVIRYPFLLLKTLFVILKECVFQKEKPNVVFAPNPSIILASLFCALKNILNFKLVIDRHSNFFLEKFHSKKLKWRMFHYVSKYSIRTADLTIVTNDGLCDIVNTWGGNGFVLQDRLPKLNQGEKLKLEGEINIVSISSFEDDEPIQEIIDAGNKIDDQWIIFITGNYKYKRKEYLLKNLPPNVRLTGYLPEKDFQSLVMSADLLIVLTTEENLLTCGAYEGISLSKPMVVSDTSAIRNYFIKGVIYSKPDCNSISNAIKYGILYNDSLKSGVEELREDLKINWSKRFNKLCSFIDEL